MDDFSSVAEATDEMLERVFKLYCRKIAAVAVFLARMILVMCMGIV
ncbi:MAG: hypothetical protein ACOX0T_01590 [Pelotomaculum sp.]|jgi:hypothetical protein